MESAKQIVKALGGLNNIKTVDACMTKLRVIVKDINKVSDDEVFTSKLNAKGVIRALDGLQLVYGRDSLKLLKEILLVKNEKDAERISNGLISSLGGKANIHSVDACMTKLRVIVKDMSKVSDDKVFIEDLNAKAVIRGLDGLQLVYGEDSMLYKEKIEEILE